jgi:hypothetical protein
MHERDGWEEVNVEGRSRRGREGRYVSILH